MTTWRGGVRRGGPRRRGRPRRRPAVASTGSATSGTPSARGPRGRADVAAGDGHVIGVADGLVGVDAAQAGGESGDDERADQGGPVDQPYDDVAGAAADQRVEAGRDPARRGRRPARRRSRRPVRQGSRRPGEQGQCRGNAPPNTETRPRRSGATRSGRRRPGIRAGAAVQGLGTLASGVEGRRSSRAARVCSTAGVRGSSAAPGVVQPDLQVVPARVVRRAARGPARVGARSSMRGR